MDSPIITNATPYANLSPDLILHAVESIGYACNGSLLALNSYENRVYQVGIHDEQPLIVKFYRPGRWSDETILEEHQFALELNEYEIPVIAPLSLAGQTLNLYQDYRFAVFPRWGGRALELDNLNHLEWMGRFIGRFHAVGKCQPFQHRMKLTVETYGHQAYQFLTENNFIADYLKANYCRAVETALQKVEQCYQRAGALNVIRLHGDMHAGNVLWNDAGPHIVDLDDCLMGPAIQDIWMLLSGDKKQVELQLDHVLRGYEEFCDFDMRELHLIEALRTLRQLHYSAWLAKRWEDPAFPKSFPWFNTPSYWEGQVQDFNEQILLLDEREEGNC